MSQRYKILKAGTPSGLEKVVDEFLASNPEWKPEGGPQEDPNRVTWIQAMVRNGSAPARGEVQLREPKRK